MDRSELDEARIALLSPSARRLLRRPRPRYRGVLHRWAAVASVPVGLALVVGADGLEATVAAAVYALGTTLMLATSALVHARDWGIAEVETMVRLDHTAIFSMIAAGATPVALLGLQGRAGSWLLVVAWAGALAGIVVEWVPVHPPPGVMNAVYLGLGWSMIVFTPWMVRDLTTAQLALLIGGGALYSVGAIIVGARRPDPWPDVFGYHEIWHVFVVVATVAHTALVADLVT